MWRAVENRDPMRIQNADALPPAATYRLKIDNDGDLLRDVAVMDPTVIVVSLVNSRSKSKIVR